jgi:cation transport ATPase
MPINTTKKTFPVLQMDCVACAAKVESTVRKQTGVLSLVFSYKGVNYYVQVKYTSQSQKYYLTVLSGLGQGIY